MPLLINIWLQRGEEQHFPSKHVGSSSPTNVSLYIPRSLFHLFHFPMASLVVNVLNAYMKMRVYFTGLGELDWFHISEKRETLSVHLFFLYSCPPVTLTL